ncbi:MULTISPECIES: cupin domain-containing protein [unclassified Streptomyces]|uniref:cupin domain-containing protein n=1 Tax=unclassified Streptomyces TaxID=2593676 RepID=UPI00165531F8|nr:cupin domain-containing protein [Streptomyces sp. CB02980]MCB8904606.1 cupin domain-containing protein [Streptomyces sp. CB02980]
MAQQTFDPNRLTFEQGVERIKSAVRESGLDVEGRIITSRDAGVEKAMKLLEVDNVPPGFRKWQLPVYMACESQLYITVAEPGAQASPHAHNGGAGIRFIAGGSIVYNGYELTAGDWMYVPAGTEYSFEVGRYGALMCYCYCCSCA